MNVEQIREYCLLKKGAEETFPFGPDNIVFKVDDKMFLLLSLDARPTQFNVKCDPDRAEELREQYDCVTPGYHMNKKHWNTVKIDGSVSWTIIKEWIDHSYELVRKKSGKK